MSLELGVDGEAASSGVHAGHILHIVDLSLRVSLVCGCSPGAIGKITM